MAEANRIAVIAIIVEDRDCVSRLNEILHEYGDCIIGRMGIPYPKKNLSLISVAVDAPNDRVSALTGKLGAIEGLTVRTAYSKS